MSQCGKPVVGLYGALSICARPKGPLHVCNPVWDWRDWPKPRRGAETGAA